MLNKLKTNLLLVSLTSLSSVVTFGQGVGINNTGATPHASAILDASSTTKGMLIPRVTTAQKNLIASPETSLLVFDTTVGEYYYFDGVVWVQLLSSNTGWKLEGNTGTTPGTDFVGTTDAQALVVKTTAIERMRVSAGGLVGIGTPNPLQKLHVADDIIVGGGQNGDYDGNTEHVKLWSRSKVWNVGVINNATVASSDFFISQTDGASDGTFVIEPDGDVGINKAAPNSQLHVDAPTGKDVFRLQTNNSTKMFMESSGEIAIGGFFNPDDQVDIRGNVQIDQGYLRVGNATATTVRKYGVQEFTWDGTLFVNDNQPSFLTQNVGTFTIPAGIPAGTTIRVDKLMWEVDAIHEDGNEDKQIEVRVGAGAWYGYFETVQDGAIAIDWHYVNDFGTGGATFTTNQTIQMRGMDDNCCFNDELYIYNMHVKVYYSYDIPLQDGDISSEGRIYANSTSDVGDLAEYFEVDTREEGLIVSLVPGSENEYSASKNEYDQNMIGVISQNPSVVLNSPSVGPPVALAGRVKVKVRADQPLIKSGDFLTSSTGGYAIRSNEPGPTIGFAVTNQQKGNNTVEIIVQPGRFYMPTNLGVVTSEKEQIVSVSKENPVSKPREDDNDYDTSDTGLAPGKYKTINGVVVEQVSE